MEIAETLIRMVRQLDDPTRTAMIARLYTGLSYQEIGKTEVEVKADGTFEVEPDPGIRCRLLAKHPGFSPVASTIHDKSHGPIELAFGESRSSSLHIKLDLGAVGPEDLSDIAVISTPEGIPTGSADAQLWRTSHTVDIRDGVAEISLASGRYSVSIDAVQ